jgi:hypothetical protein
LLDTQEGFLGGVLSILGLGEHRPTERRDAVSVLSEHGLEGFTLTA